MAMQGHPTQCGHGHRRETRAGSIRGDLSEYGVRQIGEIRDFSMIESDEK